jgi:acetyl esterase/lipase
MNALLRLTSLLLLALCLGCTRNANGGFIAHRNIPYATVPGVDANLLSLDVYTPAPAPAKPLPVVIWVHGGGWSIGDKSNGMQVKPSLFTGAGYCFVSINYRLSPNRQNGNPNRIMYPVHEQDVASAIAWVHAHAVEYSGDPERIALMGHSSGAHLVSIVSTDESFLKAHELPLSVIMGTVSLDTAGDNIPAVMERDPVGIYENAFGRDPAVWKQASPLYHVASGKGIPPFLVVTRGMPARRKQSAEFAAALQKAGVNAAVVDATGYTHNEVSRKIGEAGEAVITLPVMKFLSECLGPNSKGAELSYVSSPH